MRNIEFSFARWGNHVNRNTWMRSRGFAHAWVLLLSGFAIAQPQQNATTAEHANTMQSSVTISSREELPDRLIVMFRSPAIADDLEAVTLARHARVALKSEKLGIAVVKTSTGDGETMRKLLAARTDVAYAVHDRVLHGSNFRVREIKLADTKTTLVPDGFYTSSPQDWAVKQAGGYGAGVPGAPGTGPWSASQGKGVTIALLDSGVDTQHPDISPNLTAAMSLVDQTALPSPCDDGSAQDQAGHGTWAASLAAGAIGPRTGLMVGVAPQASILSIKVLERVPASGTASQDALCNAGNTSGLLSWLLTGIAKATAAHAQVISISAGALLDTYSGYDAGQIALFNRAAYQAEQAGSLIVAAIGNDGEDLDNSRYVEMPAQATGVLPVMAATNTACEQNLTQDAACKGGTAGLAYYSNYGNTLGAVAAPGGSYPQGPNNWTAVTGFVRGACSMGLRGTVSGLPSHKGSSYGCFNQGHSQYVEAIGTSAAAPLVAGAAALLRAANPSLSPAQVIHLLQVNASADSAVPAINTPAAMLEAIGK